MKPAKFVYHVPKTLDEAIYTLAEFADLDGRILAGGQSLVPAMAFRIAQPSHLIDINRVCGLDRLIADRDELVIGACVRHSAFYPSSSERPLDQLLSRVVIHIAHHPIRTRGTFCGSVANADPASEWCLLVAALEGTMVAMSSRGRRSIPASDFFKGVLTTALDPDEMLIEIRLPVLPEESCTGFCEFSRRAGDFAVAAALVTYRLENGAIVDPHIAVGGVEGYPRRQIEAEKSIVGCLPVPETFNSAAVIVARALDPLDTDAANYKRGVAKAAVYRALEAASQNR